MESPPMTAMRPSVNWIHVLATKMRRRAKTLQKSCITQKRRYFWYIPRNANVLSRSLRPSPASQKWKKPGKQFVEPIYLRGVQEHEDARTSHPCERRARGHK